MFQGRSGFLFIVLAGCTGSITQGVGDNGVAGGGGDAGENGGADPAQGGAPGEAGNQGTPGLAGGSGSEPVSFTCDETLPSGQTPLRRLSAPQVRNTMQELVRFALPAAVATQVLAAVERPLSLIPTEQRPKLAVDPRGSFRRLSQDINQPYVDATFDLAIALATELTSGARLAQLVGTCATDADTGNDAACLRAFIGKFGGRAQRRPLAAADLDAYVVVAGTGAITGSGVANLVAALLASPRTLYLVEHGGTAVAGRSDEFRLDGYELAARLAYHLWDSPPDDALLEAARTGALATDSGWAAAVDRALADPRARATARGFFTEWWRLDELADAANLKNEPAFRAFAAGDLPDATFKDALVNDVAQLAEHVLAGGDGGRLADLLRSNAVFPGTEGLAKIYGVPRWTGGEPARLPAGERPGLLTRAAFLFRANAAGRTNPIMKGVFVRRNLLCDDIPDPPANALAEAARADISAAVTERQVATALTENDGTTCAGCHATLINPLGFVTEGFDALGRVRAAEKRFDPKTGAVITETAVDTRVTPHVAIDDEREVAGPDGLVDLMIESGKPAACAARQYFRHTFARPENLERDGCALEGLRAAAVSGGLQDALRALLLGPAFRQKNFANVVTGGSP